MESGSHSGIARLVQPSLGTSALFLSYVFVDSMYHGKYLPYSVYLVLVASAEPWPE
jgi:hypothetical protein